MSGHRRVKNVGYDDDDDIEDDYDEDYEGGEAGGYAEGEDGGMTEEDQEQLAIGAVKVRAILGDSPQISDFEIQEALWHYWFEVDKTVIFLKNKYQPQTPQKQPKGASRFDQAAAASAAKAETALAPGSAGKSSFDIHRPGLDQTTSISSTGTGSYASSTIRHQRYDHHSVPPVPSLFEGISWGHIPPERQTTFTPLPRQPKLGLLGGSGKPSKLAALAAARKAKENKADASSSKPSADGAQSLDAITMLDRLGGKPPPTETPKNAQPQLSKPSSSPGAAGLLSLRSKRPSQSTPKPEVKIQGSEKAQENLLAAPPKPSRPGVSQLQCSPSPLALDLCGPIWNTKTQTTTDFYQNISHALFGDLDLSTSRQGFSGPSPDDIVIQAQTKGKTPSTKKPQPDTAKVTKAVDDLNLDDLSGLVRERPRVAAKIQSKNLDIVKEYQDSPGKKELNFVVVGHIDHGKSTLMGRLLYEHKVIDQRSLDKFRKEAAKLGKESFHLAWVMDAREDEREHGVTIDYAEKNFETDNASFTILDAPGHRDFVGNMIAGTSMADFALLVIDAGENASEAGLKGQTREHAQVVRCMKLEKMIIAVNKMDTVAWSQEAFDAAVNKVTAVLSELLFKPSNLVFVPCSGLTGENITSPSPKLTSWYTGQTLVQALETIIPNRTQYLGAITSPFRLRISGFTGLSEYSEFASPSSAHEPFTAFGRVEAGTVQIGDQLIAQPGGETCIVKGITHHGKSAPWAVVGQIIGLQLTDCDEERFAKGDLLCPINKPARCITAATCKILAFAPVFPMPVDVLRGRMRAAGKIAGLRAVLDPVDHSVARDGPKVVRHGDVARVRVEFDEPVALERRDRVVLRYGGETIAAAAVERGE